MKPPNWNPGNPELFFDRELSWMDFNSRVLEESKRESVPLLERLKFLCITESNLDEFYMVRVAGLRNQKKSGIEEISLNGMTVSEILQEVSKKTKALVEGQYKVLKEIVKEFKKNNIELIESPEKLTEDEILFIKSYYTLEVSSILTPLAIDVSHPFPHILNKTLNLAIILTPEDDKTGKRESIAMVQVPSVLPRFLQLPLQGDVRRYFPLEGIIQLHLDDLFYGMKVKDIHPFRLIRDADISLGEEENMSDLLTSMKNELKNRIWGDAVRLDIHTGGKKIKETLKNLLGLEDYEVNEVPSFLNINDLSFLHNVNGLSHLKYSPITQKQGFANIPYEKIFSSIRKSDMLFHHPYESFKSVEDLLKQASRDPKVFGIKMTLYRTSSDSPILEYLSEAAENGKQVTVLVELKARFDEERNIRWAKKLEDSGVHVVYGFVGLKIHCKMLLIVRREDEILNRYVHLGTGNYNSTTARFYTDLSLFTANPEITGDVSTLFNVITSAAKMPRLKSIFAAPEYLKEQFIHLISREIENKKKGLNSRIIFKMNSLVDPNVIQKLYEASQAGIPIDLIVRGICCLKPGVKGVSENIRVRSVIGRFLEHSRIFYFQNGDQTEVYLASADCMPRNFHKRIEVMFPIWEEKSKKKTIEILDVYLKDNTQARVLGNDGKYTLLEPKANEKAINAQMEMVDLV